MIFKKKYIKYKYKYLNLKKYIEQKSGGDIEDLYQIIKIYKNIPTSGIHNKDYDEGLIEFNVFCDYLLKISTDKIKEILIIEEFKKKEDYEKVKEMNKIKGDKIKKMGAEYEELVFAQMNKIISEKTKKDNLKILKNHTLYEFIETKKGKKKINIGEIDAIVIDENKNIIAICEIKSNFDGIPDALYQAERTLKKLIDNNNTFLEDENKNKITLSKFKITKGSLLNNIFLFSKFKKNEPYINFPGSFKHGLLDALVTKNNKIINKIKESIFKKIKEKQFKQGRYNRDVIDTILEFKKENLLDHIQVITKN
jgi:hypothetical protein